MNLFILVIKQAEHIQQTKSRNMQGTDIQNSLLVLLSALQASCLPAFPSFFFFFFEEHFQDFDLIKFIIQTKLMKLQLLSDTSACKIRVLKISQMHPKARFNSF